MTTAFNDAPPAPRASSRHLTRFVVIALGIGAAMLLQAHRAPAAPVASRVPLYLGLIAVEITLVWFVAIGVRARGYHLVDLCGLRWNNWPRAAIDLICAIATVALLHQDLRIDLRSARGTSAQHSPRGNCPQHY